MDAKWFQTRIEEEIEQLLPQATQAQWKFIDLYAV